MEDRHEFSVLVEADLETGTVGVARRDCAEIVDFALRSAEISVHFFPRG